MSIEIHINLHVDVPIHIRARSFDKQWRIRDANNFNDHHIRVNHTY